MRRAAPRVLLLASTVLALAGLAALAAPVPWSAELQGLPEAALLAAFIATELWVLHITVGRHTRTISLSEVPLLLALVTLHPVGLLITRALGPLLVHLLHRRTAPVKAVVNLLLSCAESLVALAVFHAVLGLSAGVPGPLLWLAGYLAATATALLSHSVVLCVMAVVDGVPPQLRYLVRSAGIPLASALTTTTLVLVAAHALHDDPRSVVLLVALVGVVAAGYRGYAALVDRHGALERLHAFSRAVSAQHEPDDVLRSVLEQARELLQSEYAAVHLDGPEDARLVVELDRDGELRRRPVRRVDDSEGLLAAVLREGRPLLVPREERDPRRQSHLRLTGRRDVVVVPLPGERGPLGLLVAADRRGGAVRSFVHDDLRLLETVAHQAGAALQSGRLLARLQHDAHHDALTGLANRRGLLDAAASALRPGAVVGLLLLDLDGFRQVNDGLGHTAGDALLCSTAERLLSVLPDGALPARLGGDEFAVLLPDAGDTEAALALARQVRSALADPMTVHGVTLAIGASAGLAVRDGAGTPDDLLQHADLALAAARADGDLDVRVLDEVSGLLGAERLTLAADLRVAVEAGALEVHVQPKADLADQRVVGVEALLRWTHPELGPVFPDVFIPLAERSGLIVPLTSFVLRTSVEAAAGWHRDGEELHVAVNLSPRSLGDDLIVDEVLGLLAETGLPPRLLTLEVTEGSVIAEPERAERILRRLRDAGVRLSLDDFGTGYSSLTHLKRLPVHEVKIDRSFVRDMAHDDDDAAIVRSIVDLGVNLRLEVVAEGVEDDDSWQLLSSLGCDLAQGYHLSRPMPLADFSAWLRAHRGAAGLPALPVPRSGAVAAEVLR